MQLGQIIWTDKQGGGRFEQGEISRLAKKLETLRCPADLWKIDEHGEKLEIVGGVQELLPGMCDDKRLKWNWWYDRSEVGL